MTDILVDVVERGTGGRAKIPGIKVAGKTGTAQKIDPQTGKYSTKDYIVSFAGFAPADNPRIAVLVVIDSPSAGVVQGRYIWPDRVFLENNLKKLYSTLRPLISQEKHPSDLLLSGI
jgi:cell division protein FtsI/penicillin-binding protein 2